MDLCLNLLGVFCVNVTSGSGSACQVWCPRHPLGHWRELHSEADVLLRGVPGLAEPARGARGCGRTARGLSRPKMVGDGQTAQCRRTEKIWGHFVRSMEQRQERNVVWWDTGA